MRGGSRFVTTGNRACHPSRVGVIRSDYVRGFTATHGLSRMADSFAIASTESDPMNVVKKSLLMAALCAGSCLFSSAANAWWSADYKQRTKVSLNTSAQGVETKEALSGVMVPVRLHSGDFDFLTAKPDGSDLRVVAADDKTPLKYWVERFDAGNELAVLWVQVPNVSPGTDKNVIYVYAGNEKAVAEPANAALFDGAMLAAFNFAEKTGEAVDTSGQVKSEVAVQREVNGMIGAAAKFDGSQVLTIKSDKLKAAGAGPYTVSMWVKADAQSGVLFAQGALRLALAEGKLVASLGQIKTAGGDLPASAWAHVAVEVGAGKLTTYINGAQAGSADLAAGAPIEGPAVIGEGFKGLIDQLELASTVRSADWLKFASAAQRSDAKLVVAVTQTSESADAEGGGQPGYFLILIKNLTTDAWVVIIILAVMFAIAVWVMVTKALLIGKADKANHSFLRHFRDAHDVIGVEGGNTQNSTLARLYEAGMRELNKREVAKGSDVRLSGASIDAIKAAVDADLVRENHHLNAKMVLLTIAISGGPFLGLLGTVVGVMITFAAIAAAGDVNVNAIAPGIAAALLATVAGLGVAIPALFGYNYLASRIKNISSDMQIFVDEFVTRVAETYGVR
jgi:biopolymer transport protein ExbB